MALSIIQLNTNGVRNPDRRAGLLQWLRSLSVIPDIVSPGVTLNVSLGFVLLVSNLLCLLVLESRVAVSFSFVLVCPLSHSRLMILVVLYHVNSVSKADCYVWFLCMHQIVTLQETNFLIRSFLGSTQQSLHSCAEISTRSWTVRTTVLGLWLLILHLLLFITRKYTIICVKRQPIVLRYIH